jgi:hypothetical protein
VVAIMEVTAQVVGATARHLFSISQKVRAVA